MQPRKETGLAGKQKTHTRYHEKHYTKQPARCHSCDAILLVFENTHCLRCRGQQHLTGGHDGHTH